MNVHERAVTHLELNVELGEEERVGVGGGGKGFAGRERELETSRGHNYRVGGTSNLPFISQRT